MSTAAAELEHLKYRYHECLEQMKKAPLGQAEFADLKDTMGALFEIYGISHGASHLMMADALTSRHLSSEIKIKLFEWAIDLGLDINFRLGQGHSFLNSAIHMDDEKVFAALLNHPQLDIHHINDHGATALHITASLGRLPMMKALLDRRVDLFVLDRENRYPLHNAILGQSTECCLELLNRGALQCPAMDKEVDAPLLVASLLGEYQVIEALLNHGADIKARDKHGNTALHLIAVARSLPSIALVLSKTLEAGLGIDSINHEGDTALFRAVSYLKTESVIYLNEQGADLFSRGEKRLNAIEFCEKYIPDHEITAYLKPISVALREKNELLEATFNADRSTSTEASSLDAIASPIATRSSRKAL